MKAYDLINTRMGTLNGKRFSNGNVYPVTAVPHGMAAFTVQNEKSAGNWFFSPLSRSFEGLRLTHQPSPWLGDYGQLVITGQHGDLFFDEERRWSSYDVKNAVFQPALMEGYVYRDRYSYSLAPTNSGAVIRFRFAEKGINRINLIGEDEARFTAESGEVAGFTTACFHKPAFGALKEYFVLSLNVPFTVEYGKNCVSLVTREQIIECRFATSFLSPEQARINLERELSGTFEQIHAAAKGEWEEYLGKISVEGDGERKRTFYTCMYRAFLFPRRFYERDSAGRAHHLNLKTGGIAEGVLYVDNGFWDTYRTLYPYLSLIDTKLYAEIAEGIYQFYLDTGWLPKWLAPDNLNCMPGTLAEAVIADAIVKEIVPYSLAEGLFRALLHNGDVQGEEGNGRHNLNEYRKYGYIPYPAARESVNETLDCCYGDYCIAQAAKKLGYREIAARYTDYAKNYRNLFDGETGFMRAKDREGNFRDGPFDPFAWGRDYTEGSAWQNSFAVYHDIEGLNALCGGKLEKKIDALFAAPKTYSVGGYEREIHEMSEMAAADFGQCAISNQPSFHIPYIYGELGNTKKTAEQVERLAGAFRCNEEGFPGDEDNGSMAAWYLFACLGFYPMCPSRPDFTVSRPLFSKIELTLANGCVLKIEEKKMPQKVKPKIAYRDIMQGGNYGDIVKK